MSAVSTGKRPTLTRNDPLDVAGRQRKKRLSVAAAHRRMDPLAGRFISMDPVATSWGNAYEYVSNNPYTLVDSDGQAAGDPNSSDGNNGSPPPCNADFHRQRDEERRIRNQSVYGVTDDAPRVTPKESIPPAIAAYLKKYYPVASPLCVQYKVDCASVLALGGEGT